MKKILLLLLPIILSGCTINYNIKINEDLSIKENIIIKTNYEFLNPIEKDPEYAKAYYNRMLKKYDSDYNYSWNYLYEENNFGIDMNRKYESLEQIQNEESIKVFFDGIKVERNNNIITLQTVGELDMSVFTMHYQEDMELNDHILRPNDVYFSLTVPYKVTIHNADKVDKETNTYYWYIEEKTTNKFLQLSFDMNQKHFSILATIKRFPIKWLLFPLILVIIFLISKKIIEKSKLNNEV